MMMILRRFFTLLITACFALSAVMGQSSDSETSIEESYLQEAIEMMIIRETSRSDSLDQKLLALEHIGAAIERGSTNEEIRVTLEYLSLEGTQNKARMAGRLVNNHPTVRRQAAKYLGDLGTKEAKNILLKICASDDEKMVLQEAVKSLGNIGMNENDDVVNTIVWIMNKDTNSETPDNILAIAAIDAIEKLARQNKSADPNAINVIARIMGGPYANPVKQRARQALVTLGRYAAQQQQQQQKN
jgi:alkylhydroperoxidase/carboxymuconolactone decarboxylase family protein YurZ